MACSHSAKKIPRFCVHTKGGQISLTVHYCDLQAFYLVVSGMLGLHVSDNTMKDLVFVSVVLIGGQDITDFGSGTFNHFNVMSKQQYSSVLDPFLHGLKNINVDSTCIRCLII